MEANGEKKLGKKRIGCLTGIVVFIVIIVMIFGGGDKESKDSKSNHIYDNAQVRDVMNGTGTNKLGEYSVIKVASSEITDEVLNDWYFNYVKKNDFNYCVIVYTDIDGVGVYSSSGMVVKDAGLDVDANGDYSYVSRSDESNYFENGDTLKKHE